MAKYTTLGPFAFKRSAKKPNSVRALKPVKSQAEARRAFAQVDRQAKANEARRQRIAAKKAAAAEAKRAAIRDYFNLNKRGYGARGNPLQDLASGKRRLTTPHERSQTVSTPKYYVETPKGFAIVGSQKVHPYGVTTKDEIGGTLRKQGADDRKYRARGRALERDKARLEKITKAEMLNQLAREKPFAASAVPNVSQAQQQLEAIQKELNARKRNEDKTEAEGFFQALDNISRPYYGVNAGLKAIVEGERPDHVAQKVGQGLRLKRKTESWDVLEAAGVKNKWIKYGAGIPASFATDPLSYISLALAPETGGASLAALGPKAAKLSKLGIKADRAANLASKTGKARHISAAEKASKQVDEFMRANKVQHGPLTARDAMKVGKHRGITVSAGARVPFTQKFVGKKTSGRTTAKIRNAVSHEASRGSRNDVADFIAKHMAPTGQISSLTREESRIATEAAAAGNAGVTTGGTARKATQQSIDAAIRTQLGINRVQRVLRPRSTKKAVRSESARLAEKFDAGEDIGAIGKYVENHLRELRAAERKAGLDTPEFQPRGAKDAQELKLVQEKISELKGIASHPNATKKQRRAAEKQIARIEDEAFIGAQKYLPRYWIGEITKKGWKREKRIRNVEDARSVRHSASNPKTEFAETRTDPRALGEIDHIPGTPRQFARDVSGVVAKRTQDSIEAITRKKVNDALVGTARKAQPGESAKGLPTGFSIYKYDKGRLEKVSTDAVPEGSANHFVIKDAVKNRVDELTGGAEKGVGIGKYFDRATGHWKGSVTVAWPGYYLRNLVGDTMLARQAGTDARSYRQSMKISKAVRKRDKIIRKGEQITKGKDPDEALKKLSFEIDSKTYTGKELEDLATEHAAVSTGQHGSEVAQLVGADSFAANNRLARMNIRRENLPRRATFIAGLKRGKSGSEAGAHARKEHYDYGTRTEFQKQARRVIPFFAWWDLNTRKQLKMLVTRPGKVNEIYHVMNGAASAAGFEDYRAYLADLPRGKQRGLPIPIVYGFEKDGTPKVKDVQFGNVLSDLRTVLNISPSKWGDEMLARGNPLITKPVELGTNHSGFFRGEIEPDYAPWTAAPKFLKGQVGKDGIDTRAEKMLNSEIVMKLDRKTGKRIPMYRKKTDYALRSIGPWAGFALGIANAKGPMNKSPFDGVMGLTGLSTSTHDSKQGKLDRLYSQRGELQKRYDGLSNVKGGTRRRKSLKTRIDGLTNEISEVEKSAGYKVPANTQGGRKSKMPTDPLKQLDHILKGGEKDDPLKVLDDVLSGKKTETSSAKPKPSTKPKLGANSADLRKYARTVAIRAGIDPNLFEAQIQQESGFNPNSTSSAGAQGIAQIMPGTARSWGVNPNDPRASLRVAAQQMARYTKQLGSYDKALVAYNAGPGRVGKPLYPETQAYIANINAMARRANNGKAVTATVKSKNLKGDGAKIASKYGLGISSTWRSKSHNAAVGGVPNSYHTRGSKSHPKAMDLTGTEAQMQKAAAAFKSKGYTTLIHDAGSGRHLHVQDDNNVGGLGAGGGGGGSYSGASPTYSNASVSQPNGSRGASSANTGETTSDSARMLALLEYLSTKDKKYATKRLVRKKALGEFTTI